MPLSTVRNSIMTAIFGLMTGDATLSAAVSARIYDHIPHDTSYPYIEIGNLVVENIDSHTNNSVGGDVTIHVWSRYDGTKEANTILDLINAVLGDVDLGITCVETINFKRGLTDVAKDPDGKTIHGVTKYNFILGG